MQNVDLFHKVIDNYFQNSSDHPKRANALTARFSESSRVERKASLI